MEAQIKSILLVDDHAPIVLGVKTYLEKHIPNLIITCFTEGVMASKQIQGQMYDAYIIDMELQDISGMALIKKIKESNANAKIIIYTQHQGVWDIINFKIAEVDGIVIKGPDMQPLQNAVLAIFRGENYICEKFRYISIPNNDLNPDSHLLDDNIDLKDSEIQIIQLLAKGVDYKGIADETHYAQKSIPKIKARIFKKFTVNSVPELLIKAITNGFPVKQETKKKKGY